MFHPTRHAEELVCGCWLVTVTPPSWTGFHPSQIILTPSQFKRYRLWLDGGMLMQDALADLEPGEREILMSGIKPWEWDREFKDGGGDTHDH